MFSNVDTAIRAAAAEIKRDRDEFAPVVNTIIEYAKAHRMCFSDPVWQFDMRTIPDSFQLWSSRALDDACRIANLIYERHTDIVQVRTLVPYLEFEITVVGRRLARVNGYARTRGVRTERLYRMVTIDGIQFMDPEIELIDVYRTLYAPFPEEWPRALAIEERIVSSAVGGRRARAGPVRQRGAPEWQRIRETLWQLLPSNDLGILVGAWALYDLSGDSARRSMPLGEKIQLLVPPEWEPDTVVERFENTLRDTTRHRLSYKTEDVHIPRDIWLKRTIYYYQIGDQRIPLADTFNTLSYEVVPYILTERGSRVGNPYVLCRFLMIDRWIVSVLAEMGAMDAARARDRTRAIHDAVGTLRTKKSLCFGDQYDGVYRDLVAEKRKFLKSQERYPPYTPHQYMRAHGKLRSAQSTD